MNHDQSLTNSVGLRAAKTAATVLTIITLLLVAVTFLTTLPGALAVENDTAANLFASAIRVGVVNMDPDPAIAGELLELRLNVINGGSESVDDMVVEVVPSYPFSMVPGESPLQYVGTVQGYQGQYESTAIALKYRIMIDKDVPAGTYDFKIRYYPRNSLASSELTIPVEVTGRDSAEVIHIDQTALVPGKQSPLRFTITNVGSSPLRDLTFSWQDDNDVILPVGSDNTKYVKYIDVGDEAQLSYQVIADTNANPGLYKLNLHLTYEDSVTDNETVISTIAGVYVGGGTDFSVAFSESASGQTSLTVANVGSNPATSVSVSVPDQRGWRVTGSDTVTIGNLNKGDYTVATFKLQSTSNTSAQPMAPAGGGNAQPGGDNVQPGTQRIPAGQAGQTGPQAMDGTIARNGTFNGTARTMRAADLLLVSIAYTDTMGERQTVEKQVRIAPSTGVGALGPAGARGMTTQQAWYQTYWYVIAILVLLALAYYGYRRHRRTVDAGKKR